MKKYLVLTLILLSFVHLDAQKILVGSEAETVIAGSDMIRYTNHRPTPDYVRFKETKSLQVEKANEWMAEILHLSNNESFVIEKVEKDKIGMEHYTFQHYYSNIPVQYSFYKLHAKNGEVISLNGQLYTQSNIVTTPAISAASAIEFATSFIGAASYKWELPGEEKFIKWRKGDQTATYYPDPQLSIVPINGNYKDPNFRLCWKMEIYAHQPMSKHTVYVDALNGEVIWTEEEICHTDTPGSAATAYSGTRSIIADSFGGGFRLRETGRGNGIETYDLNQGTDYGNAVDFVDADNNWTSPTPPIDQYALDAHWGAEMTYDYYLTKHGRNSIDGNGFELLSFIHYDVNYGNAFWNGSEMSYGDGGSNGFSAPLTVIDITGHEITHGLTQFTAGLVYQDESGALNESFSDIFGVTIDNFGRGTTGTTLWRIGEECTNSGNGIRLMSNPSAFGDPDTYAGTGWINQGDPFDNGGVHVNSGVQNYWYYLMCEGGSGNNDNSDTYNVTGIGMDDAAEIAFRNLTVYLGPSSDFNDARFYAILSAEDLFGDCSPQVETTTNAWYAVGVGIPYHSGIDANFIPSVSNVCTLPGTVVFNNTTLTGNQATTYYWDFGDGNNSTSASPTHAYAANGTYTVSLFADADGCGSDTLLSTNLITINIPSPPLTSNYCTTNNPVIADLTAAGTGTMHWYSSPSATTPLYVGNTYTTPSLTSNTTYYVETQIPNGTQHVPPLNNAFGTGGNFYSPYSEYLEFTVYQPITINSVKVYSGVAGNKTIELWNGTGAPITNVVAYVPTGENIVNLDWDLLPGNYRIGGTAMNLYKNGTGASYPYNLSSLVSITGSSDGPNRYFYFYDWIVSSSCISARTPVIVNLNAPAANFVWNQTDQVVSFTNLSTNALTYFWDFGGGNTSTQVNPVHDYVWGGTHHVTLIVGNNGCYDTLSMDLDVIGIEENNSLSGNIYPIPFKDAVTIELGLTTAGNEIDIVAYNMLGEKVSQVYKGMVSNSNFNYTWNAPTNMAPGVYLIKINYNGKELVKRVVKL